MVRCHQDEVGLGSYIIGEKPESQSKPVMT